MSQSSIGFLHFAESMSSRIKKVLETKGDPLIVRRICWSNLSGKTALAKDKLSYIFFTNYNYSKICTDAVMC